MGAEIKAPPGTCPYCFHTHGQIYHMVSPLSSNERNRPGYGQLYISDSSEAWNRRMENNQACLHSIMEKLDALLRSLNPFAESYLQMHQLMLSNPAVNVKMVFMEHPDLDLRRFAASNAFSILHCNGKLFQQYIVPYNPLLIKKLSAHINVEVCASVKSVKDRYKYVNEGHNAASVRLQSNDGLLNKDDFLTLLDGRYVSAPEAMWRLNEFSLSGKSHVGNHEVGCSLAKPTASGKKSAVIMLLQNLMPSKGLSNVLYNKTNSDKTTA
ncbi:hypothetical protein AVEN_165007-1 [Araneus ventricosus]|uniref:Uncharacterized protein n=1 Tax=Araneus ventricosus TaxID=182803 RepID=A0A4Y2LUM8_ARAVE|nr:hypothetical protein AVEN_165007-1 [Araneus ventricosus]